MKTSLIKLLIYVIVGAVVLALATLLVGKGKSVINPTPVVNNEQEVVRLADGRQCYTFSHEATPDAPYTVSEFLDITIAGNVVAGTKTGTQAGPDMTNGYEGTISGTLADNQITAVFSYIVEGSPNKEKEIYRASLVGVEKMRYPLIEGKGMLVPDTTKEFTALSYARVGCEASN